MPDHTERVVVVGGGWAGLTAALHLATAGRTVTLLERAPQLGGRARRIRFADQQVDNGQHLMIGAYQTFLQQLQLLGVKEEDVLQRLPLQWSMQTAAQQQTSAVFFKRSPSLVSRLHSLLSTPSYSLAQKLQLLCKSRQLLAKTAGTVQEQLQQLHIDQHLQQSLLQPLCLAALSTTTSNAAQTVFAQVLQQTFMGKGENLDYLIAKTDLSNLFPLPAQRRLQSLGAEIQLTTAAKGLHIEKQHIRGVITTKGIIRCQQVILATTAQAAHRLLAPHSAVRALANDLAKIKAVPITTVYGLYQQPLNFKIPLLGLQGTTAQWVFDRAVCQQPNLAATVITGAGQHDELDNPALLHRICDEIKPLVGKDNILIKSKVVREPFAAFACDTHSKTLRPQTTTAIKGCYLAGDYTATDLPASLEGAVCSGLVAGKMANQQGSVQQTA